MDKVLYITNIGGKKFSTNFVGTALGAAKELGLEFYVVANRNASNREQIAKDEKEYGVHLFHADINRSPFSVINLKAYKQICEIIKKYEIDCIHCNTPVGGVLGRLAGKKCKVKNVIYQAHGFHFYKGAPLINWIIYYPIERLLAHYTDTLITINHEDYERAKSFKLRNNGKVYYVPGVGIDTLAYDTKSNQRDLKRTELCFDENDIILISAGELNRNKNNKVIIQAIGKIKNPSIHYCLCGVGSEKDELKKLSIECEVADNVHFLGYRTDIKELLAAADIFVMPSYREGLSRSIMEAMASRLPCIVSKIRGNVDLVKEGYNGFLCSPNDVNDFAMKIERLCNDKEMRTQMGHNSEAAIGQFEISIIVKELKKIYETR